MNVATRYAAIVVLLSGTAGCGDLENDETVDEAKVVEPPGGGGGTSTTALSGANDGKSPSSVSGCSSNFHIGDYSSNRIKATNRYATDDFGWWEWRYSNTGSCKGYQWVRLHVESLLAFPGTYLSTRYWRTNAPNNFIYTAVKPSVVNGTIYGGMWKVTPVSYLKPGTYDSQILYSPGVKSCADLASDLTVVGNWDFWDWAPMTAKICA
jgi:hypothetical protein